MRRFRISWLLGVLVVGASFSCTGGEAPVGLDLGRTMSVAVVPIMPAAASASDALPVNLIRITALAVPGDIQVAQRVTSVDPGADQWAVEVEIPLSDDPDVQYVLEIELINETDGVRTVQWSARTLPITVRFGTVPEVRQVEVVRGPLENLAVTGLVLSGPAGVREGDAFSIAATVVTSDPSATPTVFWTSLDPTVAAIDASGNGVALQPGTARIEAVVGSLTAVHTIEVTGVPAAVLLTPDAVVVSDVGEEIVFEAVVVDSRGTEVPGEEIVWSVGDERILDIVGEGRFLTVAGGPTEVTATVVGASDVSATAPVTVDIEPVDLLIEPEGVVLTFLGEVASLEAIGIGAEGESVFGLTAVWSTSDALVATVSSEGVVTAVGSGEAVISGVVDTESPAGASGPSRAVVVSSTSLVQVTLEIATVEVTPVEAVLMSVGEEQAFVARAFDAVGSEIVGVVATWTSSEIDVASIDENGVATAQGAGDTDITADMGGVIGIASLTVELGIASITLSPPSLSLAVDETATITARAFNADGEEVPADFDWGSSNTTIATVDQAGVVTAHEFGEATIFVGAGDIIKGARVVVGGEPGTLTPPSYQTAGNTELVTGGYEPPSGAHVYAPDNVLVGTTGLTVTSSSPIATSQGGTVSIDPNGDMSYTPPLGFQGTDDFDFTVSDGGSANVTIEILEMVWYHDPGADGDGLSNNPLPDLPDDFVGGPGDFIYLATGSYASGILLDDAQTLVGQGVALVVPGFGTLATAGPPPVIAPSGIAVELGTNTTVRGIDIDGASTGLYGYFSSGVTVEDVRVFNTTGDGVGLFESTGNFTFTDLSIDGAMNYGFLVSGGDADIDVQLAAGTGIQHPGRHVVRIENTEGGQITFGGGDIVSVDSRGFKVLNAVSDVIVSSVVDITRPANDALSVANSPGSVSLVELNAVVVGRSGIHLDENGGTVTVLAGDIDVRDAEGIWVEDTDVDLTLSRVFVDNAVGGQSIHLDFVTGSTTIDLLEVTQSGGGDAIDLIDVESFTVSNASSYVDVIESQGMNVWDSDIDITLATFNSDASPSQAIHFSGAGGALSITGGNITNSADEGILIESGGGAFTFGSSISGSGASPVRIDGTGGGPSDFLNFTGDITSTTLGIDVNDFAEGVIFSGTLDLQTGANPALQIIDGGQIEVTGTGNVISTTSGAPVDISNTQIGPGNVRFESVSSDGAPVGINLLATSTVGGFGITGTGPPGSGGAILNATNGVRAMGTVDLLLQDLDVTGAGNMGVWVDNSNGLTLDNVRIDGAGGRDLLLQEVVGTTTITGSAITNSAFGNIVSVNAGVSSVEMSGSTISNTGGPTDDAGLEVIVGGTANATVSSNGNTYSGGAVHGLRVSGSGSAQVDLVVDGDQFSNTGLRGIDLYASGGTFTALIQGGGTIDQSGLHGIKASVLGDAQVGLDIREFVFTDNTSPAIELETTDLSSASARLDARIIGNDVNNPTTFAAGFRSDFDGAAQVRVLVHDNTSTDASPGIELNAGEAGLGSTVDWSASITGNDMANGPIRVLSRENTTVCLNIAGNDAFVGEGSDIFLSQWPDGTNDIQLERFPGTDETDGLVVGDHIDDENYVGDSWANIVTAVDGVPHGTCLEPVVAGAPNAPPAAHPQRGITDGATPALITLTGSDADGDALSFTVIAAPTTGTLGAITPVTATTAQVIYTPAGTGDDPFTFQVDDGEFVSQAVVTMANPAPTAQDISYTTAGNTELVAGGYPAPTTPAVEDLANIFDPTPSLSVPSPGVFPSDMGGDVDLNADGSFSYLPPRGFVGDDTFIVDAGSSQATVTVTVTGRVWYQDNTAPPSGDGRSHNPYDFIGGAAGAAGAGDIIFVHAGDGTASGQGGGVFLDPGELLIGEIAGLDVPGVGQIVAPGGARPHLDDDDGPAVDLAGDNVVRGFKLTSTTPGTGIRASSVALGTSTVDDVVIETVNRGISVTNSTGTLDITNASITGASDRGFVISGGSPTVTYDGTIVSSAGIMIRAENTTGGSATFTGGPFVTSGGEGVTAFNADGDVSVELASIGPGSFRGVNLVNSDGAFTFSELGISGTDSIGFNVDGGTPDVDAGLALATLLNDNHHAVQVQNTTNGVVRFTGGSIVDNGGWGIEIQNTSGTFVDFQGPVTLIDPDIRYAQGGVHLNNVGGPVSFADLTINTSSAPGLVHQFGTGTLTVSDGSIAATETQAIDVQNATVDLALATVSVNSSNSDYGGVEYQNSVGSNTLIGTLSLDASDFTPLRLTTAGVFIVGDGTVTVVNSPAGLISGTTLGVNLSSLSTDNSFVQGLQILTSSGSFVAADGLIQNSTDEAVYLGNNNGLDFGFGGTIDNGSANSVFVLNNTGGSTFQFGDITDIGAGILLNNNSGTTTSFLGDLDVSTYDDIAFQGLNGNNITIQGLSNFLASANSDGVYLTQLEGLNQIDNLTASSGSGEGLYFGQSSGMATLEITNSNLDDSFFGNGVFALASGSATATLDISGSTLSRNGGRGIDVTASDNAVLNLILDGGNTLDANNEAVVGQNAFSGVLNVHIDGNTVTNQDYRGIYLEAGATAAGDLSGFVVNNFVDGAGDGEGIYVLGAGTNATATVEITNNSVRNTAGSGIVVENLNLTGNAADMAATLFGNSVDVDFYDIGIQLSSWESGAMCARVGGPTAAEQNSFVDTGGGSAFWVQEFGTVFQLERLALGSQTALVVAAQLEADNPALDGNNVDVFTSAGIVGVTAGTCRTPVLVVP